MNMFKDNMNKNKEIQTESNILLEYIKNQDKKVFRKALLSDFINDISKKNLNNSVIKGSEKTKGYRIQGEYGEKKFIKP